MKHNEATVSKQAMERVWQLSIVCAKRCRTTCAADRSTVHSTLAKSHQKTFAKTTVGLGTLKIAAGHQGCT